MLNFSFFNPLGFRKIILIRTHPQDVKPDRNLESLYAPLFYRDNPKLQKLIARNDKIYSRSQKFVQEHPADLKLMHLAPKKELKCGVISSSKEHVKLDYQNGLELGLDSLPKLRKFVNQGAK